MNKLETAKYFASMGIHVFPLKKYAKTPAFIGWQIEATTDVNQLEVWFSDEKFNVGLMTGERSGLNVIDVDNKNGVDGRKSLIERYGNIATEKPILQFKTPSGGYHIPVKWTPDTDVSIGSKVCGLDGVDIRGNGGYIVAPSSTIDIDGEIKSYQINDIALPMTEPVGWIKSLLCDFKENKRTERFNPTEVMQGLKEGQRNDTLFKYACHLRQHGFDKGFVTGFILQAAKLCTPVFSENEAMQVIASAFSYRATLKKQSRKIITLKEILK